MINLLKMNLRHLHHAVSTWIILLCTILTAVFCVTMTHLDISDMAQTAPVQTAESGEAAFGIYVTTKTDWIDGPIYIEDVFVTELCSGILIILCTILTAIFVHAPIKNGYIKNIAGQFPGRTPFVIADLITTAWGIFLLFFVFIATIAVTGKCLWGERFFIDSSQTMLCTLGVHYIIHAGFCAFAILLCTVTKTSAAAITVNILLVCDLGLPVYTLINHALSGISVLNNFDIKRYTLEGCLSASGIGASTEALLHSTLISAVFIIVCTLISVIIVKKRDIR